MEPDCPGGLLGGAQFFDNPEAQAGRKAIRIAAAGNKEDEEWQKNQ
jgi:hypothetical protein